MVGKRFAQEVGAERGDVEQHVVDAAALHLAVDRAGDDVARRELGARVVGAS